MSNKLENLYQGDENREFALDRSLTGAPRCNLRAWMNGRSGRKTKNSAPSPFKGLAPSAKTRCQRESDTRPECVQVIILIVWSKWIVWRIPNFIWCIGTSRVDLEESLTDDRTDRPSVLDSYDRAFTDISQVFLFNRNLVLPTLLDSRFRSSRRLLIALFLQVVAWP